MHLSTRISIALFLVIAKNQKQTNCPNFLVREGKKEMMIYLSNRILYSSLSEWTKSACIHIDKSLKIMLNIRNRMQKDIYG